ncbi:MAG: glycerophosphodiester phosphodiesterase family protein [Candidatus Cryptobacteroides sp.]|nr:glycerophosphodiester phosphodiesterase family protein [Bacteroides sp.]MCI7548771.1 glycerophosphodiester phosphodiesterase family protein [Bacteroides sp.]MCI7663135.1 glycerophosphodiester phosphodiesterase family protein [Bacteroides sp.]MDD6624612.1 glycerophosphodiester phosphodiesterase family protein [Bacteroides sp.]MDY5407327.1 glycerophosphodiester phosphodiesterase family protein [Candidatus Cryptobacteroides sp.]
MKIRLMIFIAAICCMASCKEAAPQYANRAEMIAAQIHNPNSKYVVVACHRGDWRNYPENSIPAIESIIRMGADIMELDLKLTKDSVLVLSHDWTIDRCTTGKGRVSDYTLDELKQFRLRRAHGVATDSLHICTLREALECCKDRICVNVDQGYEYYDMVLAITEELGVTDQILIKGKHSVASVAEKMAAHEHNMMYMPIIDIQKEQGQKLFQEYMDTKTVPLAYEVCWKKLTPEVSDCFKKVVESGSKLWVNTIWGSLCGYLDDDKALDCGDPAEVYDQVIALGASMIQTDRPEQLLDYLRKKGLHD